MAAAYVHEPVMAEEVLDLLKPVRAGLVIDATLGGGGHTRAVLEARPDLRVLGIDRDSEAVRAATTALEPFADRVRVVRGGFERLEEIVRASMPAEGQGEGDIVGILFDLGVSSPQLDRPERGFSYRHDAPLDMRMDSGQSLTAADVVNEYDEDRLADVIRRNGEERYANAIARRIVEERPLHTTRELVDIIYDAIPARTRRRGGHPARRTFQAIRMEVNRELPNLAAGLDDAVRIIEPGGRVAAISYHSLEDRLVKERFLEVTTATTPPGLPVAPGEPEFRRVTRGAIRPSPAEIERNPRARSARLRAIERVTSAGDGTCT